MERRVLVRHPPLRIATAGRGRPSRLLAHAALWIVVEVPRWSERRTAHLHLVAPPDAAHRADAWEQVGLARHPLAPAADDVQLPWSEVETGLRERIGRFELRMFRSPEVGLVSDLLEARGAFEHRVRQLLAPAIRTRLEEDGSRPLPAMPWRRRREQARRTERREALAAGLSSVIAAIEESRVADPWDAIRRAEVGPLEVPPEVSLDAPGPRDPMIAGNPRVS